ncbi:tyrosine-type recombinase/integrase [Peribacillus sp. SCS-26]|uniref:site-specific integrase n=1 Tax=Paraperibacillus marinus TaxID=3115295 RepID=UPI0039063778
MKGYIRKRGSLYSFTVDIGKDPATGKRKQKTKSGFKTKKEAQQALNELVYEVHKGINVIDKESTIKELSLEWFENTKRKWVNTTADTTKHAVERWIIPNLGFLKIQDITPQHGQRFMAILIENLATSTVKRVFSLLNQIINYAVDMDIIAKNPLRKIPNPVERDSDKTTWTFDQIKDFLRVAMIDRPFYHNVCCVAIFTGMRKGEIFGLRKQDIDFEKSVINIRQSIHETNSHGLEIGGPKTKTSKRTIHIDNNVVMTLKNQIRRNNELKLALGQHYEDNDLIFCRENGQPYRPSSINRPFNRLTKKAGVPQIRFHDLRHTHATLLLEIGTNPKLIADRLGHSDVKTTLNTYSHVTTTMQEKAMEEFNAAFQIK